MATIIIYNVYGSQEASDQTTDAQTFRGIESTLVTFTPITPSTAARNVTYLILVMKIVEIQQIIKQIIDDDDDDDDDDENSHN